ncbi:hypothetical protein LINPERPRIM_LOCUS3999 [Linum perenne]
MGNRLATMTLEGSTVLIACSMLRP